VTEPRERAPGAALPARAGAPEAAPAAEAPAAARPGATAPTTSLDPGTRRQTAIVAVVLGALFFGSQVLNEALPANAADQRPGAPVVIVEGARITPFGGWVATPHDGGSGLRLEKGIVVIDLYEEAVGDDAGELATAYLDDFLRTSSTQLTASDVEVISTTNGTAARFTYQGMFTGVDVAIEGEVTAIFVSGEGVLADAWSPQGSLGALLDEVRAMLETVEFRS
jgi:hypothetical protein